MPCFLSRKQASINKRTNRRPVALDYATIGVGRVVVPAPKEPQGDGVVAAVARGARIVDIFDEAGEGRGVLRGRWLVMVVFAGVVLLF